MCEAHGEVGDRGDLTGTTLVIHDGNDAGHGVNQRCQLRLHWNFRHENSSLNEIQVYYVLATMEYHRV